MNYLDERTLSKEAPFIRLMLHGMPAVYFNAIILSAADIEEYTHFKGDPFLTLLGVMENVEDETAQYMVFISNETHFCYCYPIAGK